MANVWKDFSHEYETKVFSATSFAAKRDRVLQEVHAGLVVDLGCGPLGLLLSDLARRPNTRAIGSDFCWEMIIESRRSTEGYEVQYLLADNRCLPMQSSSIDTIVSVNSFLPEARTDVELMFQEATRVLRKGGLLIALLPSFEMSQVARDKWRMPVRLDQARHREWDTLGWQCFYTLSDIEGLVQRQGLRRYHVERINFSAPEEIEHIRCIHAGSMKQVPSDRLARDPLFEHLLVAER